MTNEDFKQMSDWMAQPGNLEQKLTPLEQAQVNLYFQQYQEKIAPIIIRAMSRDDNAHFIFKL